jgi:elongator complex protein 6
VTTSADFPLVHNANENSSADDNTAPTPLERHHAAFVVGLAHRASMVLQLRMLDTGAAKDVSGVMRMSRGGSVGIDADEGVVEKEVLYFVQRDGGVTVFGRGEV